MMPSLLILTIHVLLSLALAVVFYLKTKSPPQTLAALFIMISFPLGGIIFVSIFFSPLFLTRHWAKPVLPLPEIVTKGDDNSFVFMKPLNVEEEINVIPLEEALILSNKAERRKAVLNILKKEVTKYTTFINKALENEDSETSHYAAASVLHTKRKLDLRMDEIKALYEKNPRDAKTAVDYANLLEQCLKTAYLDKTMKDTYLQENIGVLENIVNNRLDLDQAHLIRLIDLLLEKDDYEKLLHYDHLLLHDYQDTEEKYMALLKSYYVMKDKNNFDLVFRKLRTSDLIFSNDTIKIVRFWMEGGSYELN